MAHLNGLLLFQIETAQLQLSKLSEALPQEAVQLTPDLQRKLFLDINVELVAEVLTIISVLAALQPHAQFLEPSMT